MEVAVRVARHAELRLPDRVSQPPLGDERNHVEVRPPERARDGDAEQRRGDDAHGQRDALRADPERDDRLAQGDEDDERVALGEVRGRHVPAADAEHERAAVVEGDREDPEEPLQPAVLRRGRDEEPGADEGPRDERADRVPELGVRAVGEREDDDVRHADEEVGDREEERVVTERVRHRERDEQHRAHRAEDGDPHERRPPGPSCSSATRSRPTSTRRRRGRGAPAPCPPTSGSRP